MGSRVPGKEKRRSPLSHLIFVPVHPTGSVFETSWRRRLVWTAIHIRIRDFFYLFILTHYLSKPKKCGNRPHLLLVVINYRETKHESNFRYPIPIQKTRLNISYLKNSTPKICERSFLVWGSPLFFILFSVTSSSKHVWETTLFFSTGNAPVLGFWYDLYRLRQELCQGSNILKQGTAEKIHKKRGQNRQPLGSIIRREREREIVRYKTNVLSR